MNKKKEIESYLEFKNLADVELTKKEKRMIDIDLAEWITQKIFAKKYRGSKIYQNNRDFIKGQIKNCISKDEPLFLIPMFGGYKHFWNSHSPYVDFAELFVFENMTRWIAPILSAYKPGVILEFESEDITIPIVDNYPEEELDKYSASFRELVNVFAQFVPDNLKIRLKRTGEQYELNDVLERMERLRPEFEKKFFKKSDAEIDKLVKVATSNFRFDGKVDYTNLSEAEKREQIIKSNINNKLFLEADFEIREDYFLGGKEIPIVFTWGLGAENIDHWFTFRSTRASFVDFWIGRGVFEFRDDKLVPIILSKTQHERIESKLELIELESSFSALSNFSDVEAYLQ
jgi:hypothetical protein